MIIFALVTLSALTLHATAVPEDIHTKMPVDVVHVGVLHESAKGVALQWLGQHQQTPSTAMLFRKKYLGSEFLGKRNLGSEFLGKRAGSGGPAPHHHIPMRLSSSRGGQFKKYCC